MLEAEQLMLVPWLEAFERTFGAPATLQPHPFAATLRIAGLSCLDFPPVFERPELLGGTDHFAQSAALCAHVRALGFDWGEDMRIRRAPTPATFNQLLELATDGEAGYPLSLHREDAATTSTGPWLRRYLEGTIPVHVASGRFYATAHRGELSWHLATLAHDITVHALNYHLVPRSAIRELGDRIQRALGARVAELDRAGAHAPVTLTYFFDNDLNRYCYEVWFRCVRPTDFAPTFTSPANLAQLHAALDTRIRETLEGRGDAPSGRDDEIPPLQQIEFGVDAVSGPRPAARRPRGR